MCGPPDVFVCLDLTRWQEEQNTFSEADQTAFGLDNREVVCDVLDIVYFLVI